MTNFYELEKEMAEKDVRVFTKDSNVHMVKLISVFFMTGGLLNFVSQYFFPRLELIKVLPLSLILFFMGFFLQIILRVPLNDQIKTHLIWMSTFLLIPFSILNFVEYGSITIWALPFIFVILSILFMDRTVLLYLTVSTIATQAIIWIWKPSVTVTVDGSDYVVRIGLLGMAIFLALYVHKKYAVKLKENADQLKTIQQLAYQDHLTGLPNRLLFTDRLNQGIYAAKRTEKLLAVMFLDLDHFKMVNDTLGHEQGDEMLKLVAHRLRDLLRKEDTVARISGDEFMMMVQNMTDMESIKKIAEKIIYSFRTPFYLKDQKFYITASLGVATFPADGETADKLVKNADMAMYRAKEQGKNQYAFCSFIMKDQMMETTKMTNALYRALERDEFELYYQPQISNYSGKTIGLEALIRWNHPELGLVLPDKFIPVAEQTGLINPIGEWVLRKACMQNKAWQVSGLLSVRIGVNISTYQFHHPDIVHMLERVLRETGLDGDYLELEITENIAIKEAAYVVEVLKSVKKLGVNIAIDDFGTAYSSLKYLKELPVDRIKIAMPFIQGIAVSEKDEAITIAIIVLARKMGLNVIAEGVETKQQLTFLKRQMCDEIQGFYYCKPMPAWAVEALLRKSVWE